uniref:hypothetical protein n=1 Tax=Novosphingobium chloroacetimidivorans TaxID=1428314 RepID=UPI0035E44128
MPPTSPSSCRAGPSGRSAASGPTASCCAALRAISRSAAPCACILAARTSPSTR